MSNREISCPRCKTKIEFNQKNPFRPFCSDRCQLLDLGQWASEKFSIPGEEVASSAEVNEKAKESSDEDEPPQ